MTEEGMLEKLIASCQTMQDTQRMMLDNIERLSSRVTAIEDSAPSAGTELPRCPTCDVAFYVEHTEGGVHSVVLSAPEVDSKSRLKRIAIQKGEDDPASPNKDLAPELNVEPEIRKGSSHEPSTDTRQWHADFFFTTDQATANKVYDLMLDAMEKFSTDPSGHTLH